MFLIAFTVTLWTGGGLWTDDNYMCFNGTLKKSANYQFRSCNPVFQQDNKFIAWTEVKLQQLTQSRLEDLNAVIKLVCIEVSFKVA